MKPTRASPYLCVQTLDDAVVVFVGRAWALYAVEARLALCLGHCLKLAKVLGLEGLRLVRIAALNALDAFGHDNRELLHPPRFHGP